MYVHTVLYWESVWLRSISQFGINRLASNNKGSRLSSCVFIKLTSDYEISVPIFGFWHFLVLEDSDIFRFWRFLVSKDFDIFRFWHFPVLKDSDIFRFWRVQILTFSDSKIFRIGQKMDSDIFSFWHVHVPNKLDKYIQNKYHVCVPIHTYACFRKQFD